MNTVALTIAGSDPSGGAGLQADLKTFHQHGVYGACVVTLLTVQNTQGVEAVEVLSPALVRDQVRAVITDIPPVVAKTGALGSAALIELIATLAADFGFPLVVDPVMISKHGHPLLAPDAADALRRMLVPRAFLVTPNLHEAAALAEMAVTDIGSMERAAVAIHMLGVPHVLVKGGQLVGNSIDVLYSEGEFHRFAAPRIDTPHTHGTGCVYSAAITARLARGASLPEAIQGAKAFVTEAIRTAPQLGQGLHGPVNMLGDPRPLP